MAMRTIAYLRVSTGGQDLGQQKLAILDYARQHRITVDDVVEVHSSTKRAAQRAQVLALIEALTPGDRLIISEISRLGRSLRQILQIIDVLVQKGVRLIAITEAIRLEGKHTLQTKALLTLFGLFAEIGVLGVSRGKCAVSYNWLYIKWLQWPVDRCDATDFAVQYEYTPLSG